MIAGASTGRDGEHPVRATGLKVGLPIRVHPDPGPFMVVEPGTTQALIVEHEAQRLDQVQPKAGVGAQPDQVAGIGRNLGFEEHHVEHADILIE